MLITMLSSRGLIGGSSVTDTNDLTIIVSPNTTQRHKNVMHFVPRSVKIQAPRGTAFGGIFLLVSALAMTTEQGIKKIKIIFTSKFCRHGHEQTYGSFTVIVNHNRYLGCWVSGIENECFPKMGHLQHCVLSHI